MCRAGGRRCPGQQNYYARKTVASVAATLEAVPKDDRDGPEYDALRNRLYRQAKKLNATDGEHGDTDGFADKTVADGGGTLDVQGGRYLGGGFCVSPYPERSRGLNMKELSKEQLQNEISSYVEDNQDLLSQPGNYLGSWHDTETDTVYLDISVVTDRAQDARKISLKEDQIAFFDMQTFDDVIVNRDATSGGAADDTDEDESTKPTEKDVNNS